MNKKAAGKPARAMKKTTAKKVTTKKAPAKKAAPVVAKKTGIEALIAQAKPETFIEKTLPALLDLRGGKPKKSPMADFETLWGQKPPAALAKAMSIFAAHGFPGLGDYRCALEDITMPVLPAKATVNSFAALAAEDQDNSLVPNCAQLLSQSVAIGETAGGDVFFASLVKDEPYIYLMDHMDGTLYDSPFAADTGSFFMMQALCEYEEKLSDETMKAALAKLRGRTVLAELGNRTRQLGLNLNAFSVKAKSLESNRLLKRASWLLPLTGNLGFGEIKERFDAKSNKLDDESFKQLLTRAAKNVSEALYGLLRTFYLGEEDRFAKMAAACGKNPSRIAKDAAVWFVAATSSKAKSLGEIKDILAQRQRVLDLGLVAAPKGSGAKGTLASKTKSVSTAPQRASDEALAAFSSEERAIIIKIIVLRDKDRQLKADAKESIAQAKKRANNNRFVRLLVSRVTDHAVLPQYQALDAIDLLVAIKATAGIEELVPLLYVPYEDWDLDFRNRIIALFAEVKFPAVFSPLVDFIKKHPKTIKANDDSFQQGVEVNILALACKATGEIGDTQAIAALEAVAGEKADIFADARAEALVALAKLGDVAALGVALAWVKDYGGVPKLAVMWALGALGAASDEAGKKQVTDILQKEAFQNWNVNSGTYFAKMLLARHGLTRFGIPHPSLEKDARELLALHEKRMGDGPEICRWMKVIIENKCATSVENVSSDTSVKLEIDKLSKAKKQKAAVDVLIGHFGSGKVEAISQFPDLVDGLVMSLGDSDPTRAVLLFAAYKDAGGIADCSMYSNYTYAACFINDDQMMRRTIADFNSDMVKYGKEFVRETSDYSTTLCNIAALYAKLRDKENMLDCLKKVKKYHYDYESLKDEEDFADYQDDPDFLKLFE